mgnify:FL=1
MILIKCFICFFIIIFLNGCGNYKPNKLPMGVIDKSTYVYPPDPNKKDNN